MEKTKLTFKEIVELFKREDSKRKIINGQIKPTENFIKLEDLVCQKCSPEQIYKIAKLGLKSTNIKKLGQVIIESEDLEWNVYFARDVEGADILAHGQVIIESEDLEWNVYFARDVEGADVLAHGQVIIESEDPEWNVYFARDVEGADVLAHGQVIIESEDPEWNVYFARDVEGADVLAHGQVVIESEDPELNYKFARDVEGADILAHAQILYEEDQYYFEQLIKELKEKGISFEYDENGKPIKLIFMLDQIIENFDDIEIE